MNSLPACIYSLFCRYLARRQTSFMRGSVKPGIYIYICVPYCRRVHIFIYVYLTVISSSSGSLYIHVPCCKVPQSLETFWTSKHGAEFLGFNVEGDSRVHANGCDKRVQAQMESFELQLQSLSDDQCSYIVNGQSRKSLEGSETPILNTASAGVAAKTGVRASYYGLPGICLRVYLIVEGFIYIGNNNRALRSQQISLDLIYQVFKYKQTSNLMTSFITGTCTSYNVFRGTPWSRRSYNYVN